MIGHSTHICMLDLPTEFAWHSLVLTILQLQVSTIWILLMLLHQMSTEKVCHALRPAAHIAGLIA